MERILKCKKSLLIDEHFLTQIEDIYSTINQKPIFTLITKNKAKYDFNCKDDFLKYDFDENIDVLIIEGNKDNSNNIFFYFEITPHWILNYDSVSKCKYSVNDNNFDIILKDKILKLYQFHSKSDWFIGKLSLLIFFLILYTILVLLLLSKYYTIFLQANNNILYTFCFYIGIISGGFSYYILKALDKILWNKLFSPIVYYLGFQKSKWDNIVNLRNNIFWGIIVALIIGIITTIITRYI